ncbi:P2X purinoceptor 4-like isoform X1 [Tigriopus californicus]|uniref:P2X purinoceptor 4-like isoform X1 n=1 Tax=Tigriopus californicus TaxID=6832 RepID=UPI0027DA1787|nr:P2X purinoceptor 4-like isoform X1 [Tigriopus californicus]
MGDFLRSAWIAIIQYETPRLVKIHNRKVGLVRRIIQAGIIMYVGVYALYLQKGYQEFGRVESSVTTKIKGVIRSELDPDSHDDPYSIHKDFPKALNAHGRNWFTNLKALYTRIWDVADYVIPAAENGAFFVATNVIITPNQTRGLCPEDNNDVKGVTCEPDESNCDLFEGKVRLSRPKVKPTAPDLKTRIEFEAMDLLFSNETTEDEDNGMMNKTNSQPMTVTETNALIGTRAPLTTRTATTPLSTAFRPLLTRKCHGKSRACPKGKIVYKAHGPLTGYCVPTDRPNARPGVHSCEVESWCPIEVDRLPLGKKRALMADAADYTVFVKNSVAFPYFGPQFVRNNLISNNGRPCLFKKDRPDPGCQIFRLGDMVELAGGNFSHMAIKGGVVSLSIAWHCNLDYDFMQYCLPKYSFRILDDFGWNFRHAKYHEEHRRSLYKLYGIKFIITVEGRGGKFNLKNMILNIGSGLALLGVTTIICDFLLLYVKERRVVKQKKYDYVTPEHPKPTSSNGKKNGDASTENPNLKLIRDNSEHSVLRGINREVSTMSSLAPLASQEHIELHVKD